MAAVRVRLRRLRRTNPPLRRTCRKHQCCCCLRRSCTRADCIGAARVAFVSVESSTVDAAPAQPVTCGAAPPLSMDVLLSLGFACLLCSGFRPFNGSAIPSVLKIESGARCRSSLVLSREPVYMPGQRFHEHLAVAHRTAAARSGFRLLYRHY